MKNHHPRRLGLAPVAPSWSARQSVLPIRSTFPASTSASPTSEPRLETDLKISGLGNGDVTIEIDAAGVADTTVVNPQGHPSPGQQIGIVASGSETIPSDQIKNGTVELILTTEEVEVDFDLPTRSGPASSTT